MENTNYNFTQPKGNIIRIDYLFAKKDYSDFINVLTTLHEFLIQKKFQIQIPFELKVPELNAFYYFPFNKKQFSAKNSNLRSISYPDTLDGLEYKTRKKYPSSKIGIYSNMYGKKERYLTVKIFDGIFSMNPSGESLERIMDLLAYCNEKEIAFIRDHLLKDGVDIINTFGEGAYNFLLKIFSYKVIENDFIGEPIKKEYYTDNVERNIFAKNEKFIVVKNLKRISPYDARFMNEDFYETYGHNRTDSFENEWSRDSFNIIFPKKKKKVKLIVFIYDEKFPKSQDKVETFLKDMDNMLYKIINYYYNLMEIYKYLMTTFAREILINKL